MLMSISQYFFLWIAPLCCSVRNTYNKTMKELYKQLKFMKDLPFAKHVITCHFK